jgi:negative regulator of flagellin synthesis FlgM
MRVSHPGNSPVQNQESANARRADKSGKLERAYGRDEKTPSQEASATDGAKTHISARGKEMAHAKSVATDAPDVREAKIAELRRRIAEGRYNVDPHKVADRMVDEHLKSGIG